MRHITPSETPIAGSCYSSGATDGNTSTLETMRFHAQFKRLDSQIKGTKQIIICMIIYTHTVKFYVYINKYTHTYIIYIYLLMHNYIYIHGYVYIFF